MSTHVMRPIELEDQQHSSVFLEDKNDQQHSSVLEDKNCLLDLT